MTTNFRTSWGSENIHLTDARGRFQNSFACTAWAERFTTIRQGRFLVGKASVTFTKGEGYRIVLKSKDGERLFTHTEKQCPGYEKLCETIGEWLTAKKAS